MEESYTTKYHILEESHWWFLARRDIIFKLIKDYHKDSHILEIGCSGGPLIKFLQRQGFENVKGIDINKRAIEICKQKGINNVEVADGLETGLGDQQFDIVIASDVLEHIQDENKALFEWYRILKQGGQLIIFVPAFKFLWSHHDELNRHYKRYSKSGLVKALIKNGFIVERASFWNFSLFLPASLVRLSQRIFGNGKSASGQLNKITPFMNKILEKILKFENKLLSGGIDLAIGISVFAIARKS